MTDDISTLPNPVQDLSTEPFDRTGREDAPVLIRPGAVTLGTTADATGISVVRRINTAMKARERA